MISPRTVETNRRREEDAPPAAAPEERAQALAARLAEALARAWRRGERVAAEDLLAPTGFLADYPSAAWAVVREEIRQRAAAGPLPTPDEYVARFPNWENEIRRALAASPVPVSDEPRFPECGQTLAGCRLIAELGSGTEGRVFLAVQDDLGGRPVVLKVTARAGQEHLSLARLLHTHVVPLYFVQDVPDRHLRVLAMPYLGGASLAWLLDELEHTPAPLRRGSDVVEALDRIQTGISAAGVSDGPARALLSRSGYPAAVCWLGACLADGLHYAHERGLVHLDLKPANILLAADGQPLLLDFHLARAPVPAGASSNGWFGGTPGFMAPEQSLALDAVSEGRPVPLAVDARTDVYSLGMVLYVMLGGEPLAPGHVACPLHKRNPAVSRGLSAVVGKCLENDPAGRYRDASALADDLRRHLTNRPLRGVRNRSLVERWRKWRRRRPNTLGVVLLIAAACTAMAGLGLSAGMLLAGPDREARAALTEGRALLDQGRPEDAERALARGLDLARQLPGADALAQELNAERRRARRELLARAVRQAADRLRFLGDPESLSPEAAGRIADGCERLWDRRDLADGAAETVRFDLLDLAVLGAHWRVRAAPEAEKDAARRRALAVLDEAERLAGPGPVLARERAAHLAALGDRPAARAALRAAIVEPRSAWDEYALGRALLDANDLDAAAEALSRAVRNRPDAFWPSFFQGLCAHRRGRYGEAVEAFRACIALAPDTAACYCNRGLALAGLGRDAEARRDFDRALELDAGTFSARLARANLSLKEGRTDDAERDLRRALADGADPAAVNFNLALVHLARHDRPAARGALQTCLEHRPGHEAALELFARLRY